MKKGWQWPVGIIVVFSIFILVNLVTLLYLSAQRIDLVTNDYYEKSIDYQAQIDRIKRTNELPTGFKIKNLSTRNELIVTFPSSFIDQKIAGEIALYRPSDSTMDITLPIQLNEQGTQVIRTSLLTRGLWRVKINCTVDTLEYYHEELLVL